MRLPSLFGLVLVSSSGCSLMAPSDADLLGGVGGYSTAGVKPFSGGMRGENGGTSGSGSDTESGGQVTASLGGAIGTTNGGSGSDFGGAGGDGNGSEGGSIAIGGGGGTASVGSGGRPSGGTSSVTTGGVTLGSGGSGGARGGTTSAGGTTTASGGTLNAGGTVTASGGTVIATGGTTTASGGTVMVASGGKVSSGGAGTGGAAPHCTSTSCARGTCVEQTVGYKCTCPAGWGGTRCDVGSCANVTCPSAAPCRVSDTTLPGVCYPSACVGDVGLCMAENADGSGAAVIIEGRNATFDFSASDWRNRARYFGYLDNAHGSCVCVFPQLSEAGTPLIIPLGEVRTKTSGFGQSNSWNNPPTCDCP
ncbi:MAG: hypothetical protein QM756_36795 [Polyangiaceae bacterium]